MKKALLWLGPLACLALAGLYAYAWFTRDPLAVAFERIEVGMRLEESEAIVGRPSDKGFNLNTTGGLTADTQMNQWSNERHRLIVWSSNGRVDSKEIERATETTIDKVIRIFCNPSLLWRPEPVPAPCGCTCPSLLPPTEVSRDTEVQP